MISPCNSRSRLNNLLYLAGNTFLSILWDNLGLCHGVASKRWIVSHVLWVFAFGSNIRGLGHNAVVFFLDAVVCLHLATCCYMCLLVCVMYSVVSAYTGCQCVSRFLSELMSSSFWSGSSSRVLCEYCVIWTTIQLPPTPRCISRSSSLSPPLPNKP